TPIDYLDFASPVSGLGSKIGFDATNTWPGETTRAWRTPIAMDKGVVARVDALWAGLGLRSPPEAHPPAPKPNDVKPVRRYSRNAAGRTDRHTGRGPQRPHRAHRLPGPRHGRRPVVRSGGTRVGAAG